MGNLITLYHNTSNANAISISKEGIKGGMRLDAYGKGSEAEGAGVWCCTKRGYGYGGATITFQVDSEDENLKQQNDIEYILYRDVPLDEIIDIDLVVSTMCCMGNHNTVESDIPKAIQKYGIEKFVKVFENHQSSFVKPYNLEQFYHLLETGNKYCKGKIQLTESVELDDKEDLILKVEEITKKCLDAGLRKQLKFYTIPDMRDYQLNFSPSADSRMVPWVVLLKELKAADKVGIELRDFADAYIREANSCYADNIKTESKQKLEEASRNELLAKSKAETITRYNKSAGYKGFSLVDIDTTAIKTRNTIIITNRVGDYFDTVELEDILYWVGLEVDEARDKKMSLETVRRALLNAMDGMDIKVDCNCGDFVYRFAYMASVLEYKYGKPENRPSNITNPDGYGAMCKHLIALLSNKSWVKQVASTLQQWIIDEIDWVRKFLKVEEEDFQLPDEYARQLGRHGAMKKFWDKQPDLEQEEEPQEDNDETNEVGDSDTETEETTNDTPETEEQEEIPTLDNDANMPKALRDKQDGEELEEK